MSKVGPHEHNIRLRVNGDDLSVPQRSDASLLDLLRRDLGLTGAKRGCDVGTCGTCTVLVDGIARKSCTIQVSSLHETEVQTVESLGAASRLDPIQQAFIDHGAVQCGFCTPGLLMASQALLRRRPSPSLEDIQQLLKGQLCRCTGYQPIVDAIQAAAATSLRAPQDMEIGSSPPRPDAEAKVRGTCRYTPDIRRDKMLHGAVLRAGRAHAKILSINTRKASAQPGVVAVLTWEDVPGSLCFGNAIADMPALCRDLVRFAGDALAIVVAETEDIARAALPHIEVAWKDLPLVDTPTRAMSPDAPLLHPHGNIASHQKLRKGDADTALAAAEVVVSGHFETGFVEHACLEVEAAIAHVDGEDLIIESPSQNVYFDRREVARVTGWDKRHVVIRQQPMGAAFGKREDLYCQHHAALATIACGGRPIRIAMTREETFLCTTKRHPFYMDYELGARRDGTIVGLRAKQIADTGAYASWAPNILRKAIVHGAGAYEIPNISIDAWSVYTNNGYSGAFRGFGAPQVNFAVESLVDELAVRLGLDPVEIRRLNGLKLGSITATGQYLHASVGLPACLEAVAKRIGPLPANNGRIRRGVGYAMGFYGIGYGNGIPDIGSAILELTKDGRVQLRLSAVDYGQGAQVLFVQLVCRELGITPEQLEVITGDTSQCPDSGSTVASRQTYVSGNAVLQACARFDGRLRKAGWPTRTLRDVASEDTCYTQARFRASTKRLDPDTAQGDAYWPYAYGAQAAIVAVDTQTGRVKLERLVAAQDVGKALNPQQVEGQIRGAVAMGVGFALTEEYRVEKGLPVDLNFDTYRIPSAADLPDVEVVIVEEPEPTGPYGAKGVGEPPILPTAPAIANAIRNALGVRLHRLPMTPARVKAALTAKAAAQAGPSP
jgi:aldehyde oxidoreductase